MLFRLSLFAGTWKKQPWKSRLNDLFAGRFPFMETTHLEDFKYVTPDDEDIAVCVDLTIESKWFDADAVLDGIIRAILDRFEPEYESMVEVEMFGAE